MKCSRLDELLEVVVLLRCLLLHQQRISLRKLSAHDRSGVSNTQQSMYCILSAFLLSALFNTTWAAYFWMSSLERPITFFCLKNFLVQMVIHLKSSTFPQRLYNGDGQAELAFPRWYSVLVTVGGLQGFLSGVQRGSLCTWDLSSLFCGVGQDEVLLCG